MLALARAVIRGNNSVDAFLIQESNGGNNGRVPVGMRDRLLDSIEVEPIKMPKPDSTEARIGWNILADCPSMNYAGFIDALSKVSYNNGLSGSGMPAHLEPGSGTVFCFGCKSLGHLLPYCPWPFLPGWLGPKAKEEEVEKKTKSTMTPKKRTEKYLSTDKGKGSPREKGKVPKK
jgi:hypothetical protein